MKADGVLVRFGEIGIKSQPVKKRMLDRLRQNLLDAMVRASVEGNVIRRGSRLWMVGPDAERLADVAVHTLGVVSASPAREVETTLEAICPAAAEAAMAEDGWSSFAVRCNRDGEHPFTSMEAAKEAGSAIWRAVEAAGGTPKVDLSKPDLEVHMDVRSEGAFIFTQVLPGPGGLPMGVQGRALALLSDVPSFVACWMMMRRGAAIIPVHAGQAQSLPMENVEALQAWGLGDDVDLLPICTGFVAKSVLLEAACELARRVRADAVVVGDTLDSDLVTGLSMPLLRPVCGLPPEDIEAWAERIGLVDDEPEHIFMDDAKETVETALSMHRVVTV